MIAFMFACFVVKGFGQFSSSGSASISPVTKSVSSTAMPSFSLSSLSSTITPSFSSTVSNSFSSTVSNSFSPSVSKSASLSYVYTSTYIMLPSNSFSPSISQNATYSAAPWVSTSPSTLCVTVTATPNSVASSKASPTQWFDSLAGYQQMLVAFALLVGGCVCFVSLYACCLKHTNPVRGPQPVITKNILPVGRGYEQQNVRRLFSEV